MTGSLYRPPAPIPTTPRRALFGSMLQKERDLLGLLPQEAYTMKIGQLGFSRRKIVLVNEPALVRKVLIDEIENYPKNDLMVASLLPLVGDSLFISSGDAWRRQRGMVDGAFAHMRINTAFEKMELAVDAYENQLDKIADTGDHISLEAGMSSLTADIIYRTIFSKPLDATTAQNIFEAFARFQNAVASVKIGRLLWGKAFANVKHPKAILKDSATIRTHLGGLIDDRLYGEKVRYEDICADVMNAKETASGRGFTREEIVDQICVFFMAGHETTASVLTWVFFLLTQQPDCADRILEEVGEVTSGRRVGLDDIKKMVFTRSVFREVMRLYPPLGFVPRVALQDMWLGSEFAPRGSMIMISPWLIHRHEALWDAPDRFDPERFLGGKENKHEPGSYLPFGIGPRVCVGAAFALMESVLIMARLTRRYQFLPVDPDSVRPVSRLTIRPAQDMKMRLVRR